MRKTQTKQVEETINSCDICNDEINGRINVCEICEKDLCILHTRYLPEYDEDDYPLILCEPCLVIGDYFIKEIRKAKAEAIQKENSLWREWREKCQKQ